jgi:hypothetical protein
MRILTRCAGRAITTNIPLENPVEIRNLNSGGQLYFQVLQSKQNGHLTVQLSGSEQPHFESVEGKHFVNAEIRPEPLEAIFG